MVPPAWPALVHDFEPTHAQGTTNSNNNNSCVEDNIADVVDDMVGEGRDNVVVPKAVDVIKIELKHNWVRLVQITQIN